MRNSYAVIAIVVVGLIVGGSVYGVMASAAPSVSTVTSTITVTSVSTVTGSSSAISTSQTTSSATSSNAPINIGIIEDTTTSLAGFSKEAISFAQIAVNQLNAQGGIMGHKVVLYSADELPNPVAAAQQLILQDHVLAIIGVSYSGDAIAIMPTLAQYHVIGIWTTDALNGLMANVTSDYSNYKYFFRLYVPDSAYGPALSQFFSNTTAAKPTSIYWVSEDLSFAHETFVGVNQTMQQLGISVLGSAFTPLSQTDFTTIATTIASLHPSAVVLAQTGADAATFIQDLRAIPSASNINIIYIGNGALDDPYVMNSVESSHPGILNGTIYGTFPGTSTVPYNNLTTQLAQAYQALTNSTYYSLPSYTYSAVQVLSQAITTANSLDPNAIVPALQNVNYNGPTGPVAFDSSHNMIVQNPYWFVQIQSNKQVVIWPSAYATGTYQPPS